MTSNLGSDIIQEKYATDDQEGVKSALLELLGHSFRPEFINRIDDTVVFHPLGRSHIEKIAAIQLKSLEGRLKQLGYSLSITAGALAKLAEAGFDPLFGARPLKRVLQKQVENRLANAILAGEVVPGKAVKIGVVDDKLTVSQ